MGMRCSSWLFVTALTATLTGPAVAQDILSFELEKGTVELLESGDVAWHENEPGAEPADALSIEIENFPKQAVNDPETENGNNIALLGVSGTPGGTDSIGLDGGMILDDGFLSLTGPGSFANSFDVDVAKSTTDGLFSDGNEGPAPTSEYSAFVGEISSSISTGDFGSIGGGDVNQGQTGGVGNMFDGFNLP